MGLEHETAFGNLAYVDQGMPPPAAKAALLGKGERDKVWLRVILEEKVQKIVDCIL